MFLVFVDMFSCVLCIFNKFFCFLYIFKYFFVFLYILKGRRGCVGLGSQDNTPDRQGKMGPNQDNTPDYIYIVVIKNIYVHALSIA